MAAEDHITRPSPMYMQVADRLARAIKAGQYEPGSLLPSETQMIERYGVGRATVRAAIAELRAMGLVDVRHGKGTVVRGSRSPGTSVDRSISRSGKRWQLPELEELEPPAVSRVSLDGITAELLHQQDQDAFSVDRLLRDPDSGARLAQRVIIPLSVAAKDAPGLADAPDAPVPDLYQQLSDAGHALTWVEHVTARTPYPDERTTLGLTDASPLLITYRVTHGTDARPLLCEELRAPAAACRLTYPITPSKTPAKRTPRGQTD